MFVEFFEVVSFLIYSLLQLISNIFFHKNGLSVIVLIADVTQFVLRRKLIFEWYTSVALVQTTVMYWSIL